MKTMKIAAFLLPLFLLANACNLFAKADTAELYANAVITADLPSLEKLLAPNFIYIGANGHIRDKANFIKELKDKDLVVNRMTLLNSRETKVGDTRVLTFNGSFSGKSVDPRPEGLMRYTMVLSDNKGQEQVAVFQATPVIPTRECHDGNCKIK